MQKDDEYLKCPCCGNIMTVRERHSDGNLFYGCSTYPDCTGTRNWEEGNGKKTLQTTNHGYGGRCIRCEQYPVGSLSPMGLCPSCQEDFDDE